ILATKIAGPGQAWIRGGGPITKTSLVEAVEASLSRLQTDYIDLYQLHWPNRGSYHFGRTWNFAPQFDPKAEEENFLEVLQTLQELIQAGKIRHVGLSNETAWGTMKWLQLAKEHNLPRMVTIQNEYSLLCRHFEPDFTEITHCEGIGLLAWSPLARGILSGKYHTGACSSRACLTLETRLDHRVGKQVDGATEKYIELARQHGLDPCQMALAFVNSRPFVSSTLIGATSMEQLRNNIDSIDVTLSDEVLKGIEVIRREYPAPY